MKRVFLFVVLNIAIMGAMMVLFHVVCAFLGINPNDAFRGSHGLDLTSLAVFSLVWGMAGGFISLLLSKPMAKWSVGAKTIDGTEGETERWLVETVRMLADRANLKMPEVAVYHGDANAFATGAFRNHALVAVSDGLIRTMTHEELSAVLGHEMSHVANGDMVTMTLLQGVLNACVIFLSRVLAFLASNALSRESVGVAPMASTISSTMCFKSDWDSSPHWLRCGIPATVNSRPTEEVRSCWERLRR